MKIVVVYNPKNGLMQMLEDGQFDVAVLGRVLKRRRVGLIDPAPDDPTKLEVTMLNTEGKPTKKLGRYTIKKDAVQAEIEEAKKEILPSKVYIPATGQAVAKCPCCRGELRPQVIRLKQADTLNNQTTVVYRCACDIPSSS